MVSYSKYKEVKNFKINRRKNKLAQKKTKKQNNKQKQNINKINAKYNNDKYNHRKITKKKKHTKKKQYLNSKRKKTLKNTPKYIDLNSNLIGAGIFTRCNIPNYSKIDKKFKKINKSFNKIVEQNTTYVESIELKIDKLKSIYATLFFIKKKLFVHIKKQLLLDPTTAESAPIITNIKNLRTSENSMKDTIILIDNDYQKILDKLKSHSKKFNKAKFAYNKKFNKYIVTSDQVKKKKNDFNYKMLKIKNDFELYNKVLAKKDTKALDKHHRKIYNKIKKCEPKYKNAVEFYTNFINTITDREHAADIIMNKLEHLKKYMMDVESEYDKNTAKFPNWERNANMLYDILETLLPTKSLTRPAPPNNIKLPSYDNLKHPLLRIRDLLKQSALVTINRNMLVEMNYVVDFIEKIINAQKAIKKDLGKIKSDFNDYRSAEYLKTIITEIIMTHNNNIQNLSIIKYHLENIINPDAISIFTQMNTYAETMGSQRSITHRNILGVPSGTSTQTTTPVTGGSYLDNDNNIITQKGGAKTGINFEEDIKRVDDLHFYFDLDRFDKVNKLQIYNEISNNNLASNFDKKINILKEELKYLVNFMTNVTGFYDTTEPIKLINVKAGTINLQNHKKLNTLIFKNYPRITELNDIITIILDHISIKDNNIIRKLFDYDINDNDIKKLTFDINDNILDYLHKNKLVDKSYFDFENTNTLIGDIPSNHYDIILKLFNYGNINKINEVTNINYHDFLNFKNSKEPQLDDKSTISKINSILDNRIYQRIEIYKIIDKINIFDDYKDDFLSKLNSTLIQDFKNDYIEALNSKFT